MMFVGTLLVGIPVALMTWAYVGYPTVLWILSRGKPPYALSDEPEVWPMISISLPVYNEEKRIGETLEALLATDFPEARREIVVTSDASTDDTDKIVGSFADRGVRLLRLDARGGKTAAENAASSNLRGDIVVNTDASVQVMPDSIKPLVRALCDPSVGVASGRDVSTGDRVSESNVGESEYVGYEMWVRSLETRLGTIIGASGSLYAIRADLHRQDVPAHLSRDFASALTARLNGYRSVSVDSALCVVPRTAQLRSEFRRKVRTMARGLDTLWHFRQLLNPLRFADFALMLLSHKLCRWLVPVLTPAALIGLAMLSSESAVARILSLATAAALAIGLLTIRWSRAGGPPRVLAVFGYGIVSLAAGIMAWGQVLAGRRRPTWEPTRRESEDR